MNIVHKARAQSVWIDLNQDGTLRVRGRREERAAWLPVIREHKIEILAALATGDQIPETENAASWMLLYPDGRRIQKNCTLRVTREHVLRKFPDATGAAPLSDREARGVPALPGVSPEFADRLSTDDLNDIAAGDIPLETVHAYEEAAISREAEDLREHFEERAGILEHDGGLPKPEAELEAARITTTYARNRGYLWASLCVVFAEYPALLSQVPNKPGTVDTLPLGLPKIAVTKDGRLFRQGTFTGAHEVKRYAKS